MDDQINETAGEKVFYNHLIIDNIYSWDLAKPDLINCAILCRDGLPAAARGLFKNVPEDLPKKLHDLDCSLEHLIIYMQAVSSVNVGGKYPSHIPVQILQQRYTRLKEIRFQLNMGTINGIITRNSAENFGNMSVTLNGIQNAAPAALTTPPYSLVGPDAKFKLVSLKIGKHPSIEKNVSLGLPLSLIVSGDTSGPDAIGEAAQQVIRNLRYLTVYSGRISLEPFERLIAYTPLLYSLNMPIVFGGNNVNEEDAAAANRIKKAITKSCKELQHLNIRWQSYSCHGGLHAIPYMIMGGVKSLAYETSFTAGIARAHTMPLIKWLDPSPDNSLVCLYQSFSPIKYWDIGFIPDKNDLINPAIFAGILLRAFGHKCEINLWVEEAQCKPSQVGYRQYWAQTVLDFRAAMIYKRFSHGYPGWMIRPYQAVQPPPPLPPPVAAPVGAAAKKAPKKKRR